MELDKFQENSTTYYRISISCFRVLWTGQNYSTYILDALQMHDDVYVEEDNARCKCTKCGKSDPARLYVLSRIRLRLSEPSARASCLSRPKDYRNRKESRTSSRKGDYEMQQETGELQKINVAGALLIEEPKNNHKEDKE